jgi:hypothetical protein
VAYDKYGGWVGETYDATGFFHARKIGGRWWLIDPEGHRFLHAAVGVVNPGGRGSLSREAFAARFSTRDQWAASVVSLLRENGFNGTGGWSADSNLQAAGDRLVYTSSLSFMGAYARRAGKARMGTGHMDFTNGCMPLFDPEFAAFADERAAEVAELKDDPYLLGYYSDNELPFRPESLDKYLRLPSDDPGRVEAERWLDERELNVEDLSRDDYEAWRGHLVDTYLSVVRGAISKYDPNHMYLGSRFFGGDRDSPALFAAAGKHLDAIAVNIYGIWTPTDSARKWEQWSGKPCIATEWYAKGVDSGMENMSGAGWTVATQKQRGQFYQNFVLGMIESGACVGWHWFKYQDNDPTDTRADPSNRNSNKGIVNVRYEPYAELLAAMKEMNAATYAATVYFDGSEDPGDSHEGP